MQHTSNDKQALSVSTSEEQPRKIKWPPDLGVSKLEVVTMVSHLMERKCDIAISGDSKYLAWSNKEKIVN